MLMRDEFPLSGAAVFAENSPEKLTVASVVSNIFLVANIV